MTKLPGPPHPGPDISPLQDENPSGTIYHQGTRNVPHPMLLSRPETATQLMLHLQAVELFLLPILTFLNFHGSNNAQVWPCEPINATSQHDPPVLLHQKYPLFHSGMEKVSSAKL